jgi:ABC-type sugar transport system ATPase subunit
MINTPDNSEPSRPIYFSAHDIHAYYGESYIVQGISLNVHEGEILALLGRNGAGKTSTLRAIARLDDPAIHKGEIWLDHQPLHNMKAWEAAQAGIALVPEDRRVIQGLTVEENLQLAQIEKPIGWSLERIYELYEHCYDYAKKKNKDILFEIGTEEQSGSTSTFEEIEYFLEKLNKICNSDEYFATLTKKHKNIKILQICPDNLLKSGVVGTSKEDLIRDYHCGFKKGIDFLNTNFL